MPGILWFHEEQELRDSVSRDCRVRSGLVVAHIRLNPSGLYPEEFPGPMSQLGSHRAGSQERQLDRVLAEVPLQSQRLP